MEYIFYLAAVSSALIKNGLHHRVFFCELYLLCTAPVTEAYLEPFFGKLVISLKPLNIFAEKLHPRCSTEFIIRLCVREYKEMLIAAPNTNAPAFKH